MDFEPEIESRSEPGDETPSTRQDYVTLREPEAEHQDEYQAEYSAAHEAVGSAERGAASAFRWLLETVLTIAAAVALALFLQAYVVKTYVVPTGSMVPTIQLEDRIISNRLAYRFGEPEGGDVVVFQNPTHEGPPLVKRIIATEGQEVTVIDGVVQIDGQPLDESYVQPARQGDDSLVEPVIVPEGHVWLMGDNRVGSSDSRVFGSVPAAEIYGQAIFTYWPPSNFGPLR